MSKIMQLLNDNELRTEATIDNLLGSVPRISETKMKLNDTTFSVTPHLKGCVCAGQAQPQPTRRNQPLVQSKYP